MHNNSVLLLSLLLLRFIHLFYIEFLAFILYRLNISRPRYHLIFVSRDLYYYLSSTPYHTPCTLEYFASYIVAAQLITSR